MLVTQTVILAAGTGTRLGPGANGAPKPLMNVGGVPLIAHALQHARMAGCTEAIIVVGHEGARVRAAVEGMTTGVAVRFVENPAVTSPNGVSLLAAAPCAAPRFFLQMVDHLFADCALPMLTTSPLAPDERGRVLVDPSPVDLDLSDATKVRLRDGRVIAIGKAVEPWDAIDAGCFLLTPAVFDALREVPHAEPLSVSAGMRRLADRRALGSASVAGIEWVDVDTPADRERADGLLQRFALTRS
jgi:choline kinase